MPDIYFGDITFPDYSNRPKPDVAAPWIQLTPDGEINAYDFTGLEYANQMFRGTEFQNLELTFPDLISAYLLCNNWLGETAHLIFPKSVNIDNVFSVTTKSAHLKIEAPVATTSQYCCSSSRAEKIEILAPNVTTLSHAFDDNTKLKELIIDCPKVTNIDAIIRNCSAIEEVTLNFPNAVAMTALAENCSSLKMVNITIPSATNLPRAFNNTGLEAQALNAIFESLPTHTDGGNHTIGIVGTPGADSCDVTIAEQKGWTVVK